MGDEFPRAVVLPELRVREDGGGEPAEGGNSVTVTADDICRHLRRRYNDSLRYAIFFEVANGTGTHRRRTIDALVMELWPSDGLNLHALEIKVSRQDWLRELDN
jgi:hypothetical protein